MRVFVTGATGFIGRAVVPELQTGGHEVVGLARSDAAAETLAEMGAEAYRGELSDLKSLAAGARASDGVIHLAFIHDFYKYEANAEIDRRALDAMARALEGSGKPLVATSGTLVLGADKLATENDAPAPEGMGRSRALSELVLAAAEGGVRVSVVRLPPTGHGKGDHAFVPALIEIARRSGVSAYIGDGANRWPAVHRLDARPALPARSRESGTRQPRAWRRGGGHPNASHRRDDRPRARCPRAQPHSRRSTCSLRLARSFVAVDNPTSSALTRKSLTWLPQEADLLTDLREWLLRLNSIFAASPFP